ncbi:MAG: 23S rRNA (guanosine(2251)-2'-O)-methyltransferase RlmB [Deltaproteobacteria bacterium RBG_16_48_10]|nr:MAG: 23S rRNA (guanosine(2251)-2'-O)-methyltransferase RlmB [Deltaproteobacteria bacterium RBG_16_48_10]
MAQVIYGIHPIQEALKSSHFQFEKIFIGTKKPHPRLQAVIDLAHQKGIPVIFSPQDDLDQMVKGGFHQNILGLIKEIPYSSLEGILTHWRKEGTKALILILDGIQDPQNLGSLIRTALGFGAHGMVIPKDRAVGITPVVVRASAGATAHLPIVRVVNIARALEILKKEGIWVYGAAGEAKDFIYQLDLAVDLAIVIGSEGKGIRPLVKKKCDRLFSIPMTGPISSFNAAVSGGMILYEAMRQRHTFEKGKEK